MDKLLDAETENCFGNFVDSKTSKTILDNPDQWIIKHTDGMGGNAVIPGWDSTADEWVKAIERAYDSTSWIAQKRVEGSNFIATIFSPDERLSPIEAPRILALFALDDRLIGGHIRAGESAVLNASSGAGIGVMRFTSDSDLKTNLTQLACSISS